MFLALDALFVSCFDVEFLANNRSKMVHSRMQFKHQTVAGDNIIINVNSSEINASQFSLLFTFLIEGSAKLVGLGRQTYKFVSSHAQKPIPLPTRIRDLLIPIEVDEKNLLYAY